MKRAGLARAMALDPEILFFDEPSAGLDPITSKRLDDLIRQLRDDLGATIVMVTHELPSIFAIADNSVFLDNVKRTATAAGDPKEMVRTTSDPMVREFLTREGTFHEDALAPDVAPRRAVRSRSRMMRKVNPTLVGAFVLGAIGLVMAIVILFGGGKLFQPTVPVVMYFEGSVKGLQLGSAITFRGVDVGKITGIQLQYDAGNEKIYIPVSGVLYADSMQMVGGTAAASRRGRGGAGVRQDAHGDSSTKGCGRSNRCRTSSPIR